MCTVPHQIHHSTLDFTGQLDSFGIPNSIINISRTDNNSPFNLRNCTSSFKNLKITHNKDGITAQEHMNLTKINFLNCIIYRYGSGCIVSAGAGGFIKFESFFLFYFILFF
jgi:hypothetical protein